MGEGTLKGPFGTFPPRGQNTVKTKRKQRKSFAGPSKGPKALFPTEEAKTDRFSRAKWETEKNIGIKNLLNSSSARAIRWHNWKNAPNGEKMAELFRGDALNLNGKGIGIL
ncbi:hypothetical protein niasHT_011376 [Heterodera trifolii]|uniref:Uncharacterized protein n=1 Tax=Heterodera trifolii TaxID=157864 RepID=A0ABD2LJV6_9BILA